MKKFLKENRFLSLFIMLLLVGVFIKIEAKASYYSAGVHGLKQTGYYTNSADLVWELDEDTENSTMGYIVQVYNYLGNYSSPVREFRVSTNSCTITGLSDGMKYSIRIKPYSLSGEEGYTGYGEVETIPASIKNFKQERWYYFLGSLDVSWDRMYNVDKVEVSLYNGKGKKLRLIQYKVLQIIQRSQT